MEQHFQAKLRLWYSEEKISIFYYYFSITFGLYILSRNYSIKAPANEETLCSMS